jgi:phospholipase C
MRKLVVLSLVTVWLAFPVNHNVAAAGHGQTSSVSDDPAKIAATATPIKHLVVIFQENVSFDHYFGTYPNAANISGEPQFNARPDTPSVNGLSGALLANNPNLNPSNGTAAANPFRLDHTQALTADQDHDYTAEQSAFDAGLMDLFPLNVGTPGPPPSAPPATVNTTGLVMGYYDGNTVTALWNYAQHFSMSDNSYSTTFGPSTPGAINLISGQTNGVAATLNGTSDEVDGGSGSLTLIGDADPLGDVCSNPSRNQASMGGTNIGNLLTAAGVTWGSFMGGFNLNTVNPNGTTGCGRSSLSPYTGVTQGDYIPHHAWCQYYPSTSNASHARPTSVFTVGHPGDPANNEYDIADFFSAVNAGNFPQVAFLKAPAIGDGHAGYSDPLDEQNFIVNTINFLERRPEWRSTMVVVLYDDSDGWYDHQMGPIVNQSTGSADTLSGPGACGNAGTSLPGIAPANLHALGRCGYGPRQPLLVISPYAKKNFVDHSVTDQTSVLRFVEDNWLGGRRLGQGSFDALAGSLNNMLNFKPPLNRPLFLDPDTGEPR